MMQKKYLLVSLLAAAALLTGCSDSGTDTEKVPDSSTSVRSDGLTNPSIPSPSPVSTKTLEDGAMEVVKIPESITGDKDFAPVTFPSTSGSVVETDTDVTVVYNDTFDKETVHKWIGELEAKGWEVSPIDTLESPTSYNTVLTKDHKMISLYSANTDKTKNTVISFSK